MALTWIQQRDKGGEAAEGSVAVNAEFDVVYDVLGVPVVSSTPALFTLLADRPDLAVGSVHPETTSAYVRRFSAKPNGTSSAFTVTVTYRNGDPRELDLSPLERSAVIETSTESLEVPTTKKADDTPWVTAAGELLTGLTKKQNRIVFQVQKNVAAVPAWALSYADAVNSDTVNLRGLIIDPGYLMLSDLRIGNLTSETVNGLPENYFPISFTLTYNPNTWETKVWHRGLYQVILGVVSVCLDGDGEPATEPMFLDATGQQLPLPLDPNDAVTIDGWDYEQLPFELLPLE